MTSDWMWHTNQIVAHAVIGILCPAVIRGRATMRVKKPFPTANVPATPKRNGWTKAARKMLSVERRTT